MFIRYLIDLWISQYAVIKMISKYFKMLKY